MVVGVIMFFATMIIFDGNSIHNSKLLSLPMHIKSNSRQTRTRTRNRKIMNPNTNANTFGTRDFSSSNPANRSSVSDILQLNTNRSTSINTNNNTHSTHVEGNQTANGNSNNNGNETDINSSAATSTHSKENSENIRKYTNSNNGTNHHPADTIPSNSYQTVNLTKNNSINNNMSQLNNGDAGFNVYTFESNEKTFNSSSESSMTLTFEKVDNWGIALCCIIFLVHFEGFAIQETITTVLVEEAFDWSQFDANYLFTGSGVLTMLVVFLVVFLSKLFSDYQLLMVSLFFGLVGHRVTCRLALAA